MAPPKYCAPDVEDCEEVADGEWAIRSIPNSDLVTAD